MTPQGMQPVKASLWEILSEHFWKSGPWPSSVEVPWEPVRSLQPRGPTESESHGGVQESVLANPSGVWGNQ